MAALFAAAIHDVDHPGLTNQYLINTSEHTCYQENKETSPPEQAIVTELLTSNN
jgi:hypothetical protein